MLKQVLESVSEMLDKALTEEGSTVVYVKCAKSLLDKTISTIDTPENVVVVPKTQKDKRKALGQDSINYAVEVENGRLKKVCYPDGRELEGEAMMQLDGVAMMYRDAVGKTFQKGEVL